MSTSHLLKRLVITIEEQGFERVKEKGLGTTLYVHCQRFLSYKVMCKRELFVVIK